MKMKRTVLVGAVVAAAAVGGAGGAGIASAATANTTGESSIVDKIASKFNLNKTEVQAVFDEQHQAKQAERQADQKQRLAEAVTAGKLTQAQADHITSVFNEIKALRGTTDPRDLSQDVRDQIRDKMDALHDWAEANNIDMQYVMMGHGGRGGMHGMHREFRDSQSQ
jgi:ABC-type glycerol-3-phosphate transport system substrate-binding protein